MTQQIFMANGGQPIKSMREGEANVHLGVSCISPFVSV